MSPWIISDILLHILRANVLVKNNETEIYVIVPTINTREASEGSYLDWAANWLAA